MNTKTMRLPPRRISTTNTSSNNTTTTTTTTTKRKERESVLDAPHQSTSKRLKLSTPARQAMSKPASASGLLAGYLAHEFLTKGTLLGQPWDPKTRSAQEEAVMNQPDGEAKYEKLESYVQVADLLKTDGSQLAGIVNPTQLARILQL